MATKRFALITLPIYTLPLPALAYTLLWRFEHNQSLPDWAMAAAAGFLSPVKLALQYAEPWRALSLLAVGLAFGGLHLGLRKLAYFILYRTQKTHAAA